MSAIDAKRSDGTEGFDPGPDDPWAQFGTLPETEGPNPYAELLSGGPAGGTNMQDALQPKSFGSEAHGTVKSSSPFNWLLD